MIKLGTSQGNILVTLTPAEFSGLAGQSAANTPDGTNISLARIKQMADFIDNNKSQLQTVKTEATQLVQSINALVN